MKLLFYIFVAIMKSFLAIYGMFLFWFWLALPVGAQELLRSPETGKAYRNSALDDIQLFPVGSIAWYYNQPAKGGDYLDDMLERAQLVEFNGNPGQALFWYQLALSYTLPGSQARQKVYAVLTPLYIRTGRFEDALNMQYRAIDFSNNERERAISRLRFYTVFGWLKDYTRAREQLDSAFVYFTQKKEAYYLAVIWNQRAWIYNHQGDLERSMQSYQMGGRIADSLYQQHPDSATRAMLEQVHDQSYLGIGSGYMLKGKTDSALYYLAKVAARTAHLAPETKAGLYLNLGQTYLNKKDRQRAALFFDKGRAIVQQPGNKTFYMEVAVELSHSYEMIGDYATALQLQKDYVQLKDSLASLGTVHRINELETRFKMAKKDHDLARQELLLTKQAGRMAGIWWLTALLLSSVLFLAVLLLLSRKNNRNKQKLLLEQMARAKREKKIELIEAGIIGEEKERLRIARELHDGVASEVLALKLGLKALEDDFENLKYADHYKNTLLQSDVIALKLRETAHNLMPVKLREQGLYASITAYLQRVRNPGIRFNFQHYGTLPLIRTEIEKIILLTVLELIQNIIKHARASKAIIQLDYFDNCLTITVEDNGVGMPPGFPAQNKGGMGLANIKENLELLEASLDIKSSEYTGTTVLIEIPIEPFRLDREQQDQ